jgi:uncharacterized protein (DUF2141 family)
MMRGFLISLLAAALFGCPQQPPPARIEGKVIVGDSLARWPVAVGLVDADNSLAASAPLGLGAQTPLAYAFGNLSKGKYRVVALANVGADEDQNNDVFAWALDEADVDGAVKDKATAKVDVFLGMSDPRRTSVRGVLHVAPEYKDLAMVVAAIRGRANSAGEVVAAVTPDAPGSDGTRAFGLHNLEDGDYTIFAVADVGSDSDSRNNDFAFSSKNLVLVERLRGEEVNGVDLWLGVGDPDMGAIAGTISLTAALPGAELRVIGFREDPGVVGDPGVVALRRVTPGSAAGMPYRLDTLPKGTYYIAAVIEDAEGASNFRWHFTGTHDPAAIDPVGQDVADPIQVDPAGVEGAKEVTVDFALGVGRVGGDITVTNSLERVKSFAVLATQGTELMGSTIVDLPAADAADLNAARTVSYQVFGLEDGAYDIVCVPDCSGDGAFGDELGSRYTFPGTPASATIAGGGRARSDCTVDMSACR